MKRKSIIITCIFLVVCAVVSVIVYCLYPAMIGTIQGNKYYSHEQYEENYQIGFDNGVKNFEELTAQIDSYKDIINKLQDENVYLEKEKSDLIESNKVYKEFVDTYHVDGISIVNYEVDGLSIEIIPVVTGIKLGDISTTQNVPTKDGYTFVGWSLDGETILDPTVYQVTENVVLQAVYEIKVYTVKFVAGLEDGEQDIVFYQTTVTHGQYITDDMLVLADTPAVEYLKGKNGTCNGVGWGIEGYTGTTEYDENGNSLGQRVDVQFEEYPILKDSIFYIVICDQGDINDLPETPIDPDIYLKALK